MSRPRRSVPRMKNAPWGLDCPLAPISWLNGGSGTPLTVSPLKNCWFDPCPVRAATIGAPTVASTSRITRYVAATIVALSASRRRMNRARKPVPTAGSAITDSAT